MRYSVINRPQGHYRPINFRDPQLTISFPYIFVDIYTHKHHHSTHYSQTSKTQPFLLLSYFSRSSLPERKWAENSSSAATGNAWVPDSWRVIALIVCYHRSRSRSDFLFTFLFSGRFNVISWSLHADLLILFGFQCLHNLLSSWLYLAWLLMWNWFCVTLWILEMLLFRSYKVFYF